MPQLAHQGEAVRAMFIEFSGVDDKAALIFLRHIHRHIGALQERIGISTMLWKQGHADTGLDIEFERIQHKRRLQRFMDRADDATDFFNFGDARQQNCKLVAAQARHATRLLDYTEQTRCHLFQQAIAIVMA